MGFNAKAFTAGFLNQVSRDLIERRKEGRAYKLKLEEEAERAKAQHKKRMALVNGPLMAKYNSLKDLGATGAMINAAMASGPEGLMEFEKKLRKHSENTGIKNFTPSQVAALSNMTEEEISAFEINDEQVKKNLMYTFGGGAPSLASTTAPKTGLFSKIFGVNLESDIRAQLDKDAYYQGYSKMDLIEMADQDAYESLMPDTYFSITPTKAYDPVKINEKYRDAIDAANSDTLIKRLDTYQEALNYFGEKAQGNDPQMPDFMRVGGYTPEELSSVDSFMEAFKRKRRYQVTQDFAGSTQGLGYGLSFLTSPTANVQSYVSPVEYKALLAEHGGEEQIVDELRDGMQKAGITLPSDTVTANNGLVFKLDPHSGRAIGFSGSNAKGEPFVLPESVSVNEVYESMVEAGMFSERKTIPEEPEDEPAGFVDEVAEAGVDLPGFGSLNVVPEKELLEAGFGPEKGLMVPTKEDEAMALATVPREEYEAIFDDFYSSLSAEDMQDKEKTMKAWAAYTKRKPSIAGVIKENIEQALLNIFSNEGS